MFRRALSAALIPMMVIQLSGCTKTVWIGPEEIQSAKDTIEGVKTVEGEKVEFDSAGVRRADVALSLILTPLIGGAVIAGIAVAVSEFEKGFDGVGFGRSVSSERSAGR
ncbi:MAG: hypothetical protein GTO05_12515 [Gemmatimonadales bacterium]|nr:hypothetical protein [Gemmatimonadales bacterium]NIS65954.1 hypothetical protein [Gemmatimonadales bacterium]